jgi:hypothetical protein
VRLAERYAVPGIGTELGPNRRVVEDRPAEGNATGYTSFGIACAFFM